MGIISDYSPPKGNTGMILFGERNDENTVTLPTMPFSFLYNKTTITQIRVSGNTWIGFGSSTEHLAINRRDTSYNKLFYANEEENGFRLFRIRFEGNAVYNSWNSNTLVWEFSVFEDGVFRLVIEASPNSASDKFVNPEGTNPTLKFVSGKSYIFKSRTGLGTDYEIVEGSYEPGEEKYLMWDAQGVKCYSEENGQKQWIKISDPPLTRELFLMYGISELPQDLNGLLDECKLCFFTDVGSVVSEKEAYQLQVKNVVTSYPQLLLQKDDFILPTGKGIKEIIFSTSTNGATIKFALSVDRGQTYYTFNENTLQFEVIDIFNTSDFLSRGTLVNRTSVIDYVKLNDILNETIRFVYLFEKQTIESSCKLKVVKILYE